MKMALRLLGSLTLVLGVSILLLLLIAGVNLWRNPGKQQTDGETKKSIVQLELVRNEKEVETFRAEVGKAWPGKIKTQLRMDAVAIIPFYGALLTVFGLLLILCHFRHAQLLGVVVIACALLAMAYDYRENYFINRLVSAWEQRAAVQPEATQPNHDEAAAGWQKPVGEIGQDIDSLWRASLKKWLLLFLAAGLIGLLFLQQPGARSGPRLTGVLCAIYALSGLALLRGFLAAHSWLWVERWSLLTLIPLGLAQLGIGLSFLQAERFKEGIDTNDLEQEAPLSRFSALVAGVLCGSAAVLGLREQYAGQGGQRAVGGTAWWLYVALVFVLVIFLSLGWRRFLRFLMTDREPRSSFWLVAGPFLLSVLAGAYWLSQQPNVSVPVELVFTVLLLLLLGLGLGFLLAFGFASKDFLQGNEQPLTVKPEELPLPFCQVLWEEYAQHQQTHGLTPQNVEGKLAELKARFNALETEYADIEDERERVQYIQQARERLDAELVKEFYALIHAQPKEQRRAALCFSGGGVRSATFVLGVLQGLVKQHVKLKQFHYLSTVSGGGYTGSWLTAWLHRAGLMIHTEHADG